MKQGDPVFTLESSEQEAAVAAAKARVAEADARLADAKAELQRPGEIEVLEAALAEAKAMLQVASNNLARAQSLFDKGWNTKAQLDDAVAQHDRNQATVAEAEKRIAAARLPGRSDMIDAAAASAEAARHALAEAEKNLGKRNVLAPASGTVQEIYFRPGEVVKVGQAVAALLPPRNLKVRFFVAETERAALRVDQRVARLLRRLRGRPPCQDQLHFARGRVHPARDLLARAAAEARLSRRGASRRGGGRADRRPAGDGQTRPRRAIGAAMKEIAIDVNGLTKSFDGRTVVRDLSLKVPKGEIYGFLGPNGSGKTTTLRMLCGLLTPDAGEGTCLGYDIRTQSEAIKRNVGYMTQRFSLYSDLSIRENLEFVARVYGVRDPKGAASRAIARLGLTGRQDQLAGELSGGWKQRLALGACILPEPRLLLLDEPTAGVDPKARREFWDEIHTLAAEGITVLVSTHYMDEAERCHELAYIAFGELLAQGTAKEVVAESGLNTWVVSGGDLRRLGASLQSRKGIDMVAPFGAELHVSGRDHEALDAAIKAAKKQDGAHRWTRGEPSLEDVFILLMNNAKDNFA